MGQKEGVKQRCRGCRGWDGWRETPCWFPVQSQSDRWRGLAHVCVCVCVCLCASASKWEQGLGDGGSPVLLMSWQVGSSLCHRPHPRAQPPPPSPHTAPNSFFYSISGFNLVSAAPLCSCPWADVWQLKDSHLLSLTRGQRSGEWPSLMQEVLRLCFLVDFHAQG